MIQVIVFYSLKKDCTEQFADVFGKIAPQVLNEEGCLQYELFVSPYESTRFCLVERWMSQAALDNHLATKHLAEFRIQTGPWFDQKPAIQIKTIENERYL
jgi:quinol monooxygenase YgiN